MRNLAATLSLLSFRVAPPAAAQAALPSAPLSEERLGAFFDGRAAAAPGALSPQGAPPQAPPVPEGTEVSVEKAAAPGAAAVTRAEASAPSDAAPEPPIEEIPGSDWREVGRVEDSATDKDPAAAEKLGFWDKLRNGGFWEDIGDELCREAEIPADFPVHLGALRARPEYDRFLRRGIEGRTALVDRARLSVGLGLSWTVADLGGNVPVSVGVSADVSGTSLVVRRLGSKRACRELKNLADLRTIKTVLPLKAGRFTAMEEGELWAIPIVFRTSIAGGVGTALAGVPLSVSFGYSRQGGTSVTLKRLDADTLRVRIRLDHAEFYGPSLGLSFRLFGDDFDRWRGAGRDWAAESLGDFAGKELAWPLVNGEIRRYARRYLSGEASLSHGEQREDHALIELLLNPNDPAQMQALEELLSGGKLPVLDTLARLAKTTGTAWLGFHDMRGHVKDLEKSYEAALAALGLETRGFAGTQSVTGSSNGLRVKVPLLFDMSGGWGRRDERVDLLDEAGGRYRVYRGHSESSRAVLDLPFVRNMVKVNERSSVMAYTYEDKEGRVLPPVLVFVQQHGYTMTAEDTARALAVSASRMMGLAGTRGTGANPRAALPLEKVFPAKDLPQPPPPDPMAHVRESDRAPVPPRTFYRRGVAAFTMVLGDAAITDILEASPADVVRAYARARAGGPNGQALMAAVSQGKVAPDGSVEADIPPESRQAVRLELYYAHRLAEALAEARQGGPADALDAERAGAQAEALRDLVHGSVGWGLSYESLMEILVQLARPEHLSAEFVVSANAYDKKDGSVSGRYLYNRGLAEDESLKRAAEVTARFNRPSEFSD